MTELESLRPVTSHGKFFSNKGQKFFLKAMRLEGLTTAFDFAAKIRLLDRFDELKQVHTTALILNESQANSVLDLATQAGLHSIVELELSPEDLIDKRKMATASARIAHTAGHPQWARGAARVPDQLPHIAR